jgi:hypothetical protein
MNQRMHGSGVLLVHRKILLLLLNVSIGYSVIDYFIVLRDCPFLFFLLYLVSHSHPFFLVGQYGAYLTRANKSQALIWPLYHIFGPEGIV